LLAGAAALTAGILTLYECADHFIFPIVFTPTQSHLLQIMFGTALVLSTCFLVLRRHARLLGLAETEQTARQQSEEARALAHGKLQAITQTIPDIMVMVSPAGNLLWWNRNLERVTGLPPDEIPVKQGPEFFAPEDRSAVAAAIQKALQEGEAKVTAQLLTPSKPVLYEFNAAVYCDNNGDVLGLVGTGRDMTERLQTAEALRQARDRAEAASRAKSEFLANVSHEIRTPMNGVLGMTELVLETPLNPDQREYLQVIKSSAESLLTIIDDILDFSKIEAGKLTLDPAAFALRDRLGDLLKPLARRASARGLELASHVRPDVPDALVGDWVRLQQILNNLVGNAVKFTARGTVRLDVAVASQTAEAVRLHFQVADTGIGIRADKLDLIFEPFVQSDSSTTRLYGGTGLGLTISARLVEQMGGQIWVESEVGTGSTFHFTVPFPVIREAPRPLAPTPLPPGARSMPDSLTPGTLSARPAPEADARPPLRHLRILLAEDNIVNQQVEVLMLEKHGYTVHVAQDGKETLAALQEQPFDLVLMDVQMPEMDGFEVTAAIRCREKETGRHIPIIAVTAHALSGDRERCLAAGMDGYVAKPIRPAALWHEMALLFSPAQPSRPQRASEPFEMVRAASEASAEGILNRAELLDRVGRRPEILQEIIGLVQEECPRLLDAIRTALDRGSAQDVERAAHSFKGTAGSIAAREAWATALGLESCARAGDLQGAAEAFAELQEDCSRLGTELSALLKAEIR
jgi:PAS domain S-box-containing protein